MHTSPSRTPSRARRRTRILLGTLAGTALAVGAPLAASAHIHVTPHASATGETATLAFSFSHGCEDSPTTALSIDIPEGVTNVVPVAQAGWDIDRTLADNGTVQRVVFTSATPIEGGIKGEVEMDVRFDDALAGTDVAFPVTQECVDGATAWTEVAEDGEAEPELPAPLVAVEAGTGSDDEHAAHDTGGGTEAAAAVEPVTPVAQAALWAGGGGLVLGAAALAVALTGRRRRP
jgi:periplasmic copper chaperone A